MRNGVPAKVLSVGELRDSLDKDMRSLMGDKQKETLQRLLGVDDLEAMPGTMTRLLQKGVIVRLHVGRWRARRSLNLGDLGIDEKQTSDLLELGQKRLMPIGYIKRLQSIETAARNFVKTRTYETPFGWFVPVDQFQYVKDGLDGYRADYMAMRDDISSEYSSIVAKLLDEYRAIAQKAYSRKCRLEGSNGGEAVYVENFLARIKALVPSREEIEASFKFDVRLSYIPLPSLLQGGGESEDLARVIAEQNGLEDQSQEFIVSTAVQLRQRVLETLESVLATLANQGKLHPRSVVALKNLCETVGRLNWSDDPEVKAIVAKIREMIVSRASQDENVAEMEKTFKSIMTVARATIIDLGDEPRESRVAGIADVPTLAATRKARLDIGLDVTPIANSDRGKRTL